MLFTKKNISLFLLIIISITYIFFRVVENEELMYVFKPLFIIALTVNYFVLTNKANRIFIAFLVFQLIADVIFIKEDMSSFMAGIGFFFIVNVLLSFMVTNKIGIINPKDIFKIFIPALAAVLSIVFIIFASVGFMKVLVLTFGLTVAILFSVSVKYYLVSKKMSSKWMLIGVISMIVCYIFAAIIRLIKPNVVFSILEASAYCFYVFCYSRFMILEDNNDISSNKIINS